MFIVKRMLATAAAAALMTTGTVAAAASPVSAPAASLSVTSHARAGTPGDHASKLGASIPTTTLISIGVLAALVVIVLVATNNNDNNDSN